MQLTISPTCWATTAFYLLCYIILLVLFHCPLTVFAPRKLLHAFFFYTPLVSSNTQHVYRQRYTPISPVQVLCSIKAKQSKSLACSVHKMGKQHLPLLHLRVSIQERWQEPATSTEEVCPTCFACLSTPTITIHVLGHKVTATCMEQNMHCLYDRALQSSMHPVLCALFTHEAKPLWFQEKSIVHLRGQESTLATSCLRAWVGIAVHLLKTKRVWREVKVIPTQAIYGMSRQVSLGWGAHLTVQAWSSLALCAQCKDTKIQHELQHTCSYDN